MVLDFTYSIQFVFFETQMQISTLVGDSNIGWSHHMQKIFKMFHELHYYWSCKVLQGLIYIRLQTFVLHSNYPLKS